MMLFLDTSTPECRLGLMSGTSITWSTWQADRGLAKGLLGYITQTLGEQHKTVAELTGVCVFKGPGSFTGLRIGLTVANTIAGSLKIPIVGATGDEWSTTGLQALQAGEDHKMILPDYGADAHITKPRK